MASTETAAAVEGTGAQPSEGLGVIHLFYKSTVLADRSSATAAFAVAATGGVQVVTVAMLGHKADLAVMALSDDLWRLRQLQTDITKAGFELVDSYVSITEVSEYAAGVPDEMKQARLYPVLPPEGKNAWCFYPMSKRRGEEHNWFALDFDDRRELMMDHGKSGRKFAGRLVQLITASTGLDDHEWGVTLFANRPDDLKDVVYTMRFDEASAIYADFGAFYTGIIASPDEVLASLGVD
ncbi:MAG: chlorite dismutase [Acidimicrobiales bacterium]|nr:chlorite dismutase [Acidimicrobiales bacterium]